ncbi:hypothetical protein ACJJTC_005277 [Scirpophaga incertulas]
MRHHLLVPGGSSKLPQPFDVARDGVGGFWERKNATPLSAFRFTSKVVEFGAIKFDSAAVQLYKRNRTMCPRRRRADQRWCWVALTSPHLAARLRLSPRAVLCVFMTES